jgi:hypothetical protein
MGRCIVTAERGSRAGAGIEEFWRQVWIFARISWWIERGRAARSFKVGWARVLGGRFWISWCRLGMSARKMTWSLKRETHWGFGWVVEEAMPKGMLFIPK